MQARRPRGTADILPQEAARWHHVESTIRSLCSRYGYGELRSPYFEHTELFSRIGEATDIVQKEMYTFQDRGGRSLTLRPEGTVGAARAFIEHKLYGGNLPAKFYYLGPMFRYERPQAGRTRQFAQFGVEVFGAASSWADAETILLAVNLFAELGLGGLVVQLNSIGCPECRPAYRQQLLEYYRGLSPEDLCPACQTRREDNPLRLLDCKESMCQSWRQGAPRSVDWLCGHCDEHFAAVKAYLQAAQTEYVVVPTLVRGLDYYTRTVYEITSDRLGAQNTVCGGGRYDGLVEELGGPSTPGVGFALGMERLLMVLTEQGLMSDKESGLDVFVVATGRQGRRQAPLFCQQLRQAGFRVDLDFLDRSLKAQMKQGDRRGARLVLMVGDHELNEQTLVLRDMESKQQTTMAVDELLGAVRQALKKGEDR